MLNIRRMREQNISTLYLLAFEHCDEHNEHRVQVYRTTRFLVGLRATTGSKNRRLLHDRALHSQKGTFYFYFSLPQFINSSFLLHTLMFFMSRAC